jgi:hypothetical protein
MLRIAKTSPGVLDLSAVKDEHGLPVVLNGPSHRDVPDREGSNPVLQRVVAAQWVTLARLPVDVPDDDPPSDLGPPEAPVVTNDPEPSGDPEAAGTEAPPETSEASSVESVSPPGAADHVDDVGPAQPPEDDAMTDMSTKPEGSNKPSGRSDSRKAGRRS